MTSDPVSVPLDEMIGWQSRYGLDGIVTLVREWHFMMA